tara:strand:- start:421 stop:951 length:531 start_codon:yes stop_codon:yes gene_type:complete
MFAKLIYISILMNKIIILLILIILLFSVVFLTKENFETLESSESCDASIDETTGEFYCGKDNCCLKNPAGGFCNVTNMNESSFEDGGQYSGLSSEMKKELLDYNVVIDPKKVYCIDFCVNTYTRTNPNSENFGEFKDENKLSSYVSSKCAECINNHYDRLKLLKDPYQPVNCSKQV